MFWGSPAETLSAGFFMLGGLFERLPFLRREVQHSASERFQLYGPTIVLDVLHRASDVADKISPG